MLPQWPPPGSPKPAGAGPVVAGTFPVSAALLAPAWLAERAVCSWLIGRDSFAWRRRLRWLAPQALRALRRRDSHTREIALDVALRFKPDPFVGPVAERARP